MPADYRIDQIRECVLSRATGVLTDEDLLGHQRRLTGDPDFRSDLNQLWDLRNLDAVDVTADTIRVLASRNPFGTGSRRALLVDTPFEYGLARMFQAYAAESHDEIAIFLDEASATAWLESGGESSD